MSLDLAGFGSIADLIKSGVDRIWPDKTKALEIKADIDKAVLAGALKDHDSAWANALAQIEVNKLDASSGDKFQSRWRPFVGWIGGFSLLYAAIVEPMARFVATVICHYNGAFPLVDTTITLQVLFGLLGLGAMRSYDKKQGTS